VLLPGPGFSSALERAKRAAEKVLLPGPNFSSALERRCLAASSPILNPALVRYFAEAEEDAFCKEVYQKLDDFSSLMQLYVKKQNWAEATKLADEHEGKFDKSVFLPYAEWLAVQDRFDAALAAFRKAGQPELSQRMMEDLTNNAVMEGRFKDAAYYYYLLGTEILKSISTDPRQQKKNDKYLKMYGEYMSKADW
jgi:intraflagellar transport protein 122